MARLKLCSNCRHLKGKTCQKHIYLTRIKKPKDTVCSLWQIMEKKNK